MNTDFNHMIRWIKVSEREDVRVLVSSYLIKKVRKKKIMLLLDK